ncbi:MAG: AI-2E family transporter, partial [Comamonadaceae bacterium]
MTTSAEIPVPPAEDAAHSVAAPVTVPKDKPALPPAEAERERERVMLHMPVDVRSVSLAVLAVLAAVFALRWAAAVFIPLMVSLLMTYALSPVVERLQRWHVPRALGAAVILLGLGGAFGWTGYSLSGSASQLVDSLPVAAQKLRTAVRSKARTASPIDTFQQAAAQIEQAAQESSAQVAARRGVTRVTI